MTNIVAPRGGVKLSACSDPAIAEHTHETSIAAFESLDPELTARREQQILQYIGAQVARLVGKLRKRSVCSISLHLRRLPGFGKPAISSIPASAGQRIPDAWRPSGEQPTDGERPPGAAGRG